MRHRWRHVHKTLADHIEAQLTALGWVVPPINFAAEPVTFIEVTPEVDKGVDVKNNTVAITLGDEPADQDEEMGDGLKSTDFPLFVDVYGENATIARAICSDVKSILNDLYLHVIDFTSTPTQTDEYIEIDKSTVIHETPPASFGATDFRKHWRVVKAIATTYFV